MTIQTISPQSSNPRRPLVIGATLLFLMLASSVSPVTHAQTKAPYDKGTLIRGLKQSAVDKKLSSQDFVQLIAQRGVDFQMTARDEAELRIAGATNDVIEAIRMNYRHVRKPLPKGIGSLTISTSVSDCKVLVNGQLRGTTDINGVLTLPPLKAGQYRILLRKENYEELARAVQITAGVETSESFTLTPLKGSLTIVPVPADAKVTLDGTDYPQGVRNLPLEPGNHTVRVSKQGFKSVDRTATIEPGRPLSLSVILEVFRVEDTLKESINSFTQKNYPRSIALGREILAFQPDNAPATMLIGLSYYYLDQYSDSTHFLTRAIALGEQVILPIRHIHKGVFNDELCSGRITIGKGMLGFTSTDKTGHDFTVPANKIYELKFEPQKQGRVHVQVGIPKGSKEDKKTYNFHVSHAGTRRLDPNRATSIIVVYCNDCEAETQVIYQLLRQLKDAPAASASQLPPESEVFAGRPTLKRRLTDAGVAPTASLVAPPSSVFRSYSKVGRFKLTIPDNWKEVTSSAQNIVLAPEGGSKVVDSRTHFSHGVQIGIVPTRGAPLPQAFGQLVSTMLKSEAYMRQVLATQPGEIKGRPALTAPLRGNSPVSQQDEFALVYAVMLKSGDLLYVIAVSPYDEVSAYSATFGRIIGSIEFLD